MVSIEDVEEVVDLVVGSVDLEFVTHHLAQLHLVDHAVAVPIPRAPLMMEAISMQLVART